METIPWLNWLNYETAHSVGWTLVHSLWQGVLFAAVAGIFISFSKKSSSALRYNVLCGLMLLFSLIVTITYIRLSHNIRYDSGFNDQPDVVLKNPFETQAVISDMSASSMIRNGIGFIENNLPVIVLIWLLFVSAQFIRLFFGLRYIYRIRRIQVYPVPEKVLTRFLQLKDQLGISQHVRIIQSGLVKIPSVVGFAKPIVLIPLSLLANLPLSSIESILLHELAHIRRKDFIVNLFQCAIDTLFFFNPAVRWISGLIREEREACCDDIVLQHGGDKRSYVESLIYFQEDTHVNSYAMALTRKTYLLTRVRRMLTQQNNKLTIMEKNYLAIGLISLSALAFASSTAQTNKEKSPEKVTPAETTVKVTPVITADRATEYIAALNTADAGEAVIVSELAPSAEIIPVREVISVMHADTVPLKAEDITTIRRIDDDDKNNSQTTIITNEGKTIYYEKTDGAITKFKVDGKEISKEEMNKYSGFLAEMDKREKEIEEHRLVLDQRRKEMDIRRGEMDAKRLEMDKRRVLVHQTRVDADQRKVERLFITDQQHRTEADKKRTEIDIRRKEMDQKRIEMDKKREEMEAKMTEMEQQRAELEKKLIQSEEENNKGKKNKKGS